MRIYFSGIGGTGIAPLANLAIDAGFEVFGSDAKTNQNTDSLSERGAKISNNQNGNFLEQIHQSDQIDWLVYTSSLPKDHPELVMAEKLGIKATKRDIFIDFFVKKHNFEMIAVAGTHGKTSTTTMLIWLFKQLGIPASHLVGSTLSFANSGHFESNSKYFIYEADEYDRNFLAYQPKYSLITSIDWDHVDIYPTQKQYFEAFREFINQSENVWLWQKDFQPNFSQKVIFGGKIDLNLTLIGKHNRQNAQLVLELAQKLNFDYNKTIEALNSVKTAGRRFEILAPNLISDYAHHPTEIAATLEMTREYCRNKGFDKIITVYEPHQVDRQKQFRDLYPDSFKLADKVYWLPTYYARGGAENKSMTASELGIDFANLEQADFDQKLVENLKNHLKNGDLVIAMSAGNLDDWIRQKIAD